MSMTRRGYYYYFYYYYYYYYYHYHYYYYYMGSCKGHSGYYKRAGEKGGRR